MVAVLTAKTKYGIKAMIHLAEIHGEKWAQGAEIAEAQQVPKKFLDTILLELKGGGLLHSRKGKGGGYYLSRPPAKISVGEIIRTLDGALAPIACASKLDYHPCLDCSDEARCRVRMVMVRVRDTMAEILDNTSLLSLVDKRGRPVILHYDI